MRFKSNEKGKCPICNSENLSYGPMELEGILGSSVAFPWHCPDCDANGKEWYITEFDITESGDGNTINEPEVCPDCGFEINYGSTGLDGDSLYYEYNCTECNGSGREYYTLEFDGHTVEDDAGNIRVVGIKDKQEEVKVESDVENEPDEPDESDDINLNDTISLLDMALSDIPTIGVEDWGKDDELNFIADTKVMFENLKDYEEKIPKYYYDNADSDDWSNGIDSYLSEVKGIDPESGKSDNTYNWGAPLTHDVEFTVYETKEGCYFKGSIHRAGDVRGNYTTEFLLLFDDWSACFETLSDTCSEDCQRSVTIDNVEYIIEPNFLNEYVNIWCPSTQESYDEVYCTCIEELREIVNKNKTEESKKIKSESTDRIRDYIEKFKSEIRSEKYTKGLSLRNNIVDAWKAGDLETAYNKWSELYDLFSDGWDDEGNQTPDWTEEQNYRDIYELQTIVDTIENQCVYDVTDYGKEKAYKEMGY